jgi:hypothetical protein
MKMTENWQKLRLDLAPGGEEIIINAARQGVGLPAAGGLALHRVHAGHPEPPAHTQHNHLGGMPTDVFKGLSR